MDTAELIDRYCAVWNEPDAAKQEAALADLWTEGASYIDPSVEAVGAPALVSYIAASRRRWPGFCIERMSAVDRHHRTARFAWRAVDESGATLVEGLDIADLSADGSRIDRIVGFFGSLDTDGAAG